jgi:Ca-activated chloride channel family protein
VIPRANILQKILGPIVWVLVVISLARPQWVEDPIEKIQSARDLMLAVDISQSMETSDFVDPEGNRVSRLDAVKLVLDDFIARRKGDRIGLVLFGAQPFVQVPFTLDHDAARILLGETEVGMAGPRTVVGDAIGLSVKVFENSQADQRVLILLTDGNDTGSKIPPPKAAEIAGRENITIHTIAIGDPEGAGEDMVDLAVMEDIAGQTGGLSFRAENRGSLEGIYRELDAIEPQDFETLSYRPKRPLYYYPAGAAILLVFGYHLVMLLVTLLTASRREERVGT